MTSIRIRQKIDVLPGVGLVGTDAWIKISQPWQTLISCRYDPRREGTERSYRESPYTITSIPISAMSVLKGISPTSWKPKPS